MEQKSCKIFINIVFLISIIITVFSGNKVYGVTESQKLKEIETDINYNYYNVNECGSNYNRELIVSENGGQNVYGCVPIAGNPGTNAPNMVCSGGTKAMVPTTTNSYVWICRASKPSSNEGNLIYAANVSSAFYDTLIDAEGCRNAASKIVTFNGSKNIKGCMYDGQEGFATCPSDSKENLLNISDNYGSVYSFKICTKNSTDSGDSPNQEETETPSIESEEITPPSIDNCKSLLGDPTKAGTPSYYIVVAFKVVRYVAIILLVVLSVVDLVGAVASSDSDILNKTVAKIFKRFILCIIIFLLPMLLQFILHFINENYTICGVGE